MRKWQSASIAFTAMAVMLGATACGSEGGENQTAGAAPAGNANYGQGSGQSGQGSGYGDAGSGTAAQGKAQPAGKLAVWDSKQLGPVLTDSKGMTLYRFDKDSAKPAKSTCVDACAEAWPIVSADDVSATAGIDSALLGEVNRPDGTKQLTVDGWPMYRYAKDTKPNEANGQGVGGTWYASAPDGKKASPTAEAGGGAGADLPPVSVGNANPELGPYLRGSGGRTLYRFDKDSAWPMKSACTGECLEKWKPAEALSKEELSQVEGIDPKLLTPFKRPDGTQQLTVDCWPLYTYVGDEKPGDVNGQGVGGTWWAVTPDGKKITKEVAQDGDSKESSGGGYDS